MDRVLLDTDVVSYILKGDTRARPYLPYLTGKQLWVSFMVLAELERWALSRGWGARRKREMDDYVRELVVVPSSAALCRAWAEVTVAGLRRGRPIPCADPWIAATALHYDLPLVTNNLGHFDGIEGLRLAALI